MSAPAPQDPAPPADTGPRPVAAPTTRALLATLRATLLDAGAAGDGLRDLDAWIVWVVRLIGEPPSQSPAAARGLGDYGAARELVVEVSSRVVRAGAGAPVARREALLASVAAWERTAVACLDQHLLQRGRRR